MKLTVLSVVFCALASLVTSINVPAVGSVDDTSCAGGVVTKASTFKSLKGDDILMKEVACPAAGSLKVNGTNTSQKLGRLLAREETPAINPCELTCENNDEIAFVSDCDDLEDALIEDTGIADPLIVAPDTILFFSLGSCEMNYENLLEFEDNSIPKATFGSLGVTINDDCLPFGTGECISEDDDYAFATVAI